KDRPLVVVQEAEQLEGILAHHLHRAQLDLLALARQPLVDGERDDDLVGDAAWRHHLDGLGSAAQERAAHTADHRALPSALAWKRIGCGGVRSVFAKQWHSATATASAASAGRGAVFNRSSR